MDGGMEGWRDDEGEISDELLSFCFCSPVSYVVNLIILPYELFAFQSGSVCGDVAYVTLAAVVEFLS